MTQPSLRVETTTAADCVRARRQALRRHRRPRSPRADAEPDDGADAADAGRSVRRPGTGSRAPERGHPAAERQRHDARGQPIPASGSAVGDVFAYGLRNTFGIAFDPCPGRVGPAERRRRIRRDEPRGTRDERGLGPDPWEPVGRIQQFKQIETTLPRRAACREQRSSRSAGRRPTSPTARKRRSRAHVPAGIALQRSGVQQRFATPPAGIGFLSRALGPQYQNDLFAKERRPPRRWAGTCSAST